jgi:hypothetical protein
LGQLARHARRIFRDLKGRRRFVADFPLWLHTRLI